MDTGKSHIDLVERLESHGVRPTAVRLLVLATICSSSHPLSSLEIETLLETVDRSTVTRSLALFSEKGAHLQSSVFKLSKDLIDSIHEEGIVAYTS